MSVASVLPAVRRDLERPADSAGGEDDRSRFEKPETSALAIVAESTRDALAVLEERDDGLLHVHVDRLMDRVILERADHLETGAVAHVREPRVAVSAEVALENAPIGSPIEQRAPRFELAD